MSRDSHSSASTTIEPGSHALASFCSRVESRCWSPIFFALSSFVVSVFFHFALFVHVGVACHCGVLGRWEAGGRVATNVMVRDLDLTLRNVDGRKFEVVDGCFNLEERNGVVCALHRNKRRRAAVEVEVAMTASRRSSHRRPENKSKHLDNSAFPTRPQLNGLRRNQNGNNEKCPSADLFHRIMHCVRCIPFGFLIM